MAATTRSLSVAGVRQNVRHPGNFGADRWSMAGSYDRARSIAYDRVGRNINLVGCVDVAIVVKLRCQSDSPTVSSNSRHRSMACCRVK